MYVHSIQLEFLLIMQTNLEIIAVSFDILNVSEPCNSRGRTDNDLQ